LLRALFFFARAFVFFAGFGRLPRAFAFDFAPAARFFAFGRARFAGRRRGAALGAAGSGAAGTVGGMSRGIGEGISISASMGPNDSASRVT